MKHVLLYVQETFGITDCVVVSEHESRFEAEHRALFMNRQLAHSKSSPGAHYRIVTMSPDHINQLRYEKQPDRPREPTNR